MNTFTNATKSIAGETSILTGKLPSTTRVLANPDYLMGEDKYQHLPGILKDRGYQTISLGVPFYVDANLIQFQDAFDDVNCMKKPNDQLSIGFAKLNVADEYIFFDSLYSRITERLLHIFFIKDIDYPFLEVTDWKYYPVGDKERLNCLYSYLEETKNTGTPLFAHIHQMSTHGQWYKLSKQVFSKGQVQSEEFQTDFYDDSLLAFDSVVQELVEYLQDNQMYDNTILVIYTDHPQLFKTAVRTPLIIHFPRDQFSGSININTQTIDIPPTILDYLSIQQPSWMEGDSLLGELEPDRLIFSFDTLLFSFVRNGIWQVVEEVREPPFYQFAKVTVIQGSTFHNFILQTNESSIGKVEDYVESDREINLYSHEEIKEKTRQLLLNAGFEISNDW